jgi:hypothetical protein
LCCLCSSSWSWKRFARPPQDAPGEAAATLCRLLERARAVRRGRKACDLLRLRRDGAPCHVGRVVLHRLPRPQSQDSHSADRVRTGGPGQPSRSVEMLPEGLSAPLGRGPSDRRRLGRFAVSRRRVAGAHCPRDRRQVPRATGSASAGATVLLPVWVVIGLAGTF